MSSQFQCAECGAPLRDNKFKTCFNCHQKARTGAPAKPSGQEADFMVYLKEIETLGYFQDNQIRDPLLISQAQLAAQWLHQNGVTKGQLGQFYEPTREFSPQARHLVAWSSVRSKVVEFNHKAHKIVARSNNRSNLEKSLLPFITFHVAQIENAQQPQVFLDGFARHLNAVWSYFTYLDAKHQNR